MKNIKKVRSINELTKSSKTWDRWLPLAGIWEGDKGDDTAPSDNRGTETNKFRERISFEPMGPVNNHEQALYGLRYSTIAWPSELECDPFHEESGYWLWDAKAKQVLRCFIVPRGVAVIAGGTVEPDAQVIRACG